MHFQQHLAVFLRKMGCGESKKKDVIVPQMLPSNNSSNPAPLSTSARPVNPPPPQPVSALSPHAPIPTPPKPSETASTPAVQPAVVPAKQSVPDPKLADYTPTAHYTVLIWAGQAEALEPFATATIQRFDAGREVAITPLTVTSLQDASLPRVIDAVLYLISDKSEVAQAKEVHAKYKHVWLHLVQSMAQGTEIDVFISETEAQVLPAGEDYIAKVLSADKDLHILLKTVFQKIDSDGSGAIEGRELVQAARELKQEVSAQEVETALGEMDANKDSKVSFAEFRDWWKRGRQGAVSVHKAIQSWAERTSAQVPGAVRELNALMHKKEKKYQGSQSSFQLSIGPDFPPKLSLSLDLGSGKAREALTVALSSQLGYTTKPTWLAIVLPCSTASPDPRLVKTLDGFWKAQFEMVMSMSADSAVMRNLVGVDVRSIGKSVVSSMWLNTDDDYCEPLCRAMDNITNLLDIPLDQSLHFELNLASGVQDLQNRSSEPMMLSLFERFQLNVQWVMWVKMLEILVSSERRKRYFDGEHASLWLGLFEGLQVDLAFDSLASLPEDMKAGGMTAGAFFTLFQKAVLVPLSFLPFYLDTINQVFAHWTGQVEISGKLLNIGFKVRLLCPDLKKLFEASSKSIPKKKMVSKY